jgi:hypothetical protein
MSLGGRETSRHIEAAAASQSSLGYWKRALRSGELYYVFKPREEPLPWSHVRGSIGLRSCGVGTASF